MIKLIHSDIEIAEIVGYFEPDDVTVLLTAPTGFSVININGMTMHSGPSTGT